jgi:prepilin-type processing-associated H-X9-DG protein
VFYPIAQTVTDQRWLFGSCHPTICQFVFVDGHVHVLPSSLDPVILGLLCQRDDGQPIPDLGF